MVLVIQFREDATREHEQFCIGRFLDAAAVRYMSIFDWAVPIERPAELLAGVDRLILGGSAGLSMAPGHDHVDYTKIVFILRRLAPLAQYVLDQDFPTLGLCFGHQLLSYFAGGEVVFDKAMAESGVYDIELTEPGRLDGLFAAVPTEFKAVLGHTDSVTGVMPGAVCLARSRQCPIQALRFGQNVYGTQFHGELTAEDHRERMKLFPHYLAYARALEPVPTPFGVRVLENFLGMVSANRS